MRMSDKEKKGKKISREKKELRLMHQGLKKFKSIQDVYFIIKVLVLLA